MMTLILCLFLLWTIIHGVNYFWRASKQSQSLLPAPRAANTFARRRVARTTNIILNKFHIRVQTSAWNGAHDAFSKLVSARSGARLRFVMMFFYNAGTVAGVLGTVVALGLLMWNCSQMLAPAARAMLLPPSSTSPPPLLARRGMGEISVTGSTTTIKPLIPGVTVPFSHLPAILLAVFLSQVIHELGHAISAALDAVPIMSAGASFTVAIPAAFVTFPTTAMAALRPWARARLIAAGPFHNLVFWSLLLLVDRVGIGAFLTRDISNLGRVVLDVDGASDLWGHLPIGSLITRLDDTFLGSPQDLWSAYLTTDEAPDLGWCVDRAQYSANPQSCCEPEAPFSPLSCFVAITSTEKGCLDAIPILTGMKESRCETDSSCSSDLRCVRPHESAHLLRLTIDNDGEAQVVLWSGPRTEVLDQVRVGKNLPRIRLVPLWAHTSATLLWGYLKLATLSLYLFNLLPLPHLDGSQFTEALLEMLLQEQPAHEEYDVEALEAAATAAGRRNRGLWKERLSRIILVATTFMFVLSTLLALINMR